MPQDVATRLESLGVKEAEAKNSKEKKRRISKPFSLPIIYFHPTFGQLGYTHPNTHPLQPIPYARYADNFRR